MTCILALYKWVEAMKTHRKELQLCFPWFCLNFLVLLIMQCIKKIYKIYCVYIIYFFPIVNIVLMVLQLNLKGPYYNVRTGLGNALALCDFAWLNSEFRSLFSLKGWGVLNLFWVKKSLFHVLWTWTYCFKVFKSSRLKRM